MRVPEPERLEAVTLGDGLALPSEDVVSADLATIDSPASAAVPTTDRARLWQDTSSWLTSLVLHLIWFILVTSMTVPWAGQAGRGQRSQLSLVMGFAENDDDSQAIEFSATTDQESTDTEADHSVAPSEPVKPAAEVENQPADSVREPAEDEPDNLQPENNPANSPLSQYSHWLQQRLQEPIQESSSSRYAAILRRTRSAPISAPRRSLTDSGMMPVAEAHVQDVQQQTFDRIVDDFIEYDIGRLRGKEGQEARRRFMELGPDSIPALVRGLNKSASIHASCPVGVLAGKLIQSLRGVRDASLTQYAIDNVGRGVPEDAPHYRRIMALRRRWLGNLHEVSDPIVTVVARQTLADDGELLELVLALADAPAETLLAALDSGDERLSTASVIALAQSKAALPFDKRRQIIGTLTRLSDMADTAQERALIREALQAVRTRS